jgi:hypothetical protein
MRGTLDELPNVELSFDPMSPSSALPVQAYELNRANADRQHLSEFPHDSQTRSPALLLIREAAPFFAFMWFNSRLAFSRGWLCGRKWMDKTSGDRLAISSQPGRIRLGSWMSWTPLPASPRLK